MELLVGRLGPEKSTVPPGVAEEILSTFRLDMGKVEEEYFISITELRYFG